MTTNSFISSPYIKKIWTLTNKDSITQKSLGNMVGDGRIELVFVSGNGYVTNFDNNKQLWGEGIYIGGHINKPFELEVLPETQMTFVKLETWAAVLLSGFDFRQSMNCTIPLAELNKELYQKMFYNNGPTFAPNSFMTLNSMMEDNWKAKKNAQLIQLVSSYLEENFIEFNFHKKELLQKINLSSRSLELKFGRGVGLPPQKFANTIRFRQIIEHLYHVPDSPSLTELSFNFGFYDQAHFIRSCQQFMGISPSNLSKDNCFVTNSTEKFRYYTI